MLAVQMLKKNRDIGIIFLCSLAVVGMILFAYGHKKSNSVSAFWQETKYARPGSSSEFHEVDKKLDISTPSGWRGKLQLDTASKRLVINLVDFTGEPVKGLFLAAQVFSRKSSSLVYQGILNQNKDGNYRSSKTGIKPGTWDISITARNPNSANDTDFLFHIEKRIKVK